jgi:hypothetical protein
MADLVQSHGRLLRPALELWNEMMPARLGPRRDGTFAERAEVSAVTLLGGSAVLDLQLPAGAAAAPHG